MAAFTFAHAADLHLDAPFRGVSDRLLASCARGARSGAGGALARLLREATFMALQRLTELCIQEKADFLLLAGDVYNSADSSLRARLALRDAFVRLEGHGVRVFLAHGNHDPLRADASAVPWPGNVTVFGPRPESVEVTRQGEPLAVIHGISHSGAKEEKNLAALFKRVRPACPEVFQVGLLHCALSGLTGAHALYAPCAFGDLAETAMDYWALGHVHACRLLDRQGTPLPCRGDVPGAPLADGGRAPIGLFAAYPGSPQGLHVNENGAHGCLLLRAQDKALLAVEHVPLAPVRWEALSVEIPQDTEDLPCLEKLLLDRLTPLSPGGGPAQEPSERTPFPAGEGAGKKTPHLRYPPEAVIIRISLNGRSGLHHALLAPGTDALLCERLNEELEGVWIRDLTVNTRPLTDLDITRERPDIVGATLRRASSVQRDPEELARMAEQCLAPLFQRPKLNRLLAAPQGEELARLAEEASLLCLDLLEGE
jgi:DNA repair exonuclease SbcCD nuclease subunit